MDALRQVLHQSGQIPVQKSPYEAIRQAASETGADFDYLWRTAQRESGLNPAAKAQTSSATGLFQFTSDTWIRMLERYGDKYGVVEPDASSDVGRSELLELRKDPVVSAQMAGELANENAAILSNLIGREATSEELYAAHFLGPSGAAELINTARQDPGEIAEELFPEAAAANPAIFNGSDGSPRSVAAVYARLTGDMISDIDQASGATDEIDRPVASTIFGQRSLGGVDVRYTAEEAMLKAKANHTLMAALIELQTKAREEE